MAPTTDADYARRAYDLSVRTEATLKAHLETCDARSRQIIESVNAKHAENRIRMDDLASGVTKIQNLGITLALTIIGGLGSIIVLLLQTGHHF